MLPLAVVVKMKQNTVFLYFQDDHGCRNNCSPVKNEPQPIEKKNKKKRFNKNWPFVADAGMLTIISIILNSKFSFQNKFVEITEIIPKPLKNAIKSNEYIT